MSLLRLSDVVSGAVCLVYDVAMGKKASLERFGSQVVYRSLARKANEMTSLPPVSLPLVAENDLYTGGIALADSKLRKKSSNSATLHDGVRATLSSVATGYIMTASGLADKVLL
jgi:hypothetical protein